MLCLLRLRVGFCDDTFCEKDTCAAFRGFTVNRSHDNTQTQDVVLRCNFCPASPDCLWHSARNPLIQNEDGNLFEWLTDIYFYLLICFQEKKRLNSCFKPSINTWVFVHLMFYRHNVHSYTVYRNVNLGIYVVHRYCKCFFRLFLGTEEINYIGFCIDKQYLWGRSGHCCLWQWGHVFACL